MEVNLCLSFGPDDNDLSRVFLSFLARKGVLTRATQDMKPRVSSRSRRRRHSLDFLNPFLFQWRFLGNSLQRRRHILYFQLSSLALGCRIQWCPTVRNRTSHYLSDVDFPGLANGGGGIDFGFLRREGCAPGCCAQWCACIGRRDGLSGLESWGEG